jgi:predicted nucleic acid-binding protein
MEENLILCDTDVLIDYFDKSKARHQQTKQIIEHQISLDKVVISAITKMELFLGATNKVELNKIDKLIGRFGLLLINRQITKKSLDLLKSYHLSHNLAIPDSIIASTAIVADLELFTYNVKDFRFVKNLNLYNSL